MLLPRLGRVFRILVLTPVNKLAELKQMHVIISTPSGGPEKGATCQKSLAHWVPGAAPVQLSEKGIFKKKVNSKTKKWCCHGVGSCLNKILGAPLETRQGRQFTRTRRLGRLFGFQPVGNGALIYWHQIIFCLTWSTRIDNFGRHTHFYSYLWFDSKTTH